jgi:hypothetical protein
MAWLSSHLKKVEQHTILLVLFLFLLLQKGLIVSSAKDPVMPQPNRSYVGVFSLWTGPDLNKHDASAGRFVTLRG